MASQTILATVLPNGLTKAGAPMVSVYLSPRLDAPTLAGLPDWLNWTSLVKAHGLTFAFVAGGGAAVDVALPQVALDGLRPDLWGEIFKPSTYVAPYPRPDYAERLVVSYPARTAHDFIKWAWQTVGAGVKLEGRLLEVLFGDLSFRDGQTSTLPEAIFAARQAIWNEQHPPPVPQLAGAVPSKPAATRDMAQRFVAFHRPAYVKPPPWPQKASYPSTPPLPGSEADFAKTLDFHKAIAALTAYPPLMRFLGLVFDVELPAGACPASPQGLPLAYETIALQSLTPGWTWRTAPKLSLPQTAYVFSTSDFAAAPATSPAEKSLGGLASLDVIDGFLALPDSDFEVVGVELDGAMLKAMTLADNVANADPERIDDALPALRSGGLSLLADGRALELVRAIADNTAFHAAEDGGQSSRPLDARDLTRGYRIDIWSSRDNAWRSLHRRDGRYAFGPQGHTVLSTTDEEGFTQLGVTQPTEDPERPSDPQSTAAGLPQPGTDLFIHDRIARWNGWSLSAPRPGTPINRSGDPTLAADPDDTANEPITPFKLKTTFTAHKGSLPSLRFGTRYRLRARAVDLAGNSPALAAATPANAAAPSADPVPHLRFEPVPSPVIVELQPSGKGGSLLHLVIRSRNTAPALDGTPTSETDERHIVPPKAGVDIVEQHGMLDDAHGRLKGDAATYALVVERDKGAFPTSGRSPIFTGDQAPTPWFPDPIARGAAFAGLPGAPVGDLGEIVAGKLAYAPPAGVETRAGSVTQIGFGDPWPDRTPFRLRLVEGTGAPAWDGTARTLTVSLPKSGDVDVPTSAYVAPTDLQIMGVWDWMRAWFEAAEAQAMQDFEPGEDTVSVADSRLQTTRQALEGGHPLITPPETLTLTHAVQQPLGRPTWRLMPVEHDPGSPTVQKIPMNPFAPITAWRSAGSHHAFLLGGLKIHGASTAKVDIDARWTEYLDDTHLPGPTTQPASDHVETIELKTLDGTPLAADASGTRLVSSYIPAQDTLWFAAPFDVLPGQTPPSDVAAPAHQLGDTKHRRVRYRAVSTSRFAEYFEPGLDFTRAGDRILVDVPSSARPASPDVLYVLPTFGWEQEESTNVKSDIRRGNGLRVYLNRPWYSSGEGELLGVTLWPDSQSAPDDTHRAANRAWFTQWGLDPLWATSGLEPVPASYRFPAATAIGTDLSLENVPINVDVAGHPVTYDADRRLWSCDIEFATPFTYAPFVRLALARYQPFSIPGAELSHVVLADFAQLTPDRAATLTQDPADPRSGRLFVGGIAPSAPTRNLIEITVERRREDIGGDLGWRAATPAEATVTEDSPPPSAPAATLWMGSITFPTAPAPDVFRVVIREYELHPADSPLEREFIDNPYHAERLIYAAIIPWSFPAP
jgi:hypothetical protein